MTEIKITVDGESGPDKAVTGAAESSSRAFAHAEGSSAPSTGQATQAHGDEASGDSSATGTPSSGAAGAGAAPDGSRATVDAQITAEVDEALEIEGELDELVKTAKQRDDYLALAQRTQADFENYRKRVAREAAAAQERGVGSLAKELLPALDNLDRALEAAAEDDPLLQGVRLVRSELKAALARVGHRVVLPARRAVRPVRARGGRHAAQPPGGRPSGTVVEVYQHGYRLGEGILRPARVVVAA